MDETAMQNQLAQLMERLEQLEQRVETLEKGGSKQTVASVSSVSPTSASQGGSNDAVIEAIRLALSQINEGDVGAIRQQMVKNGQPNTLTRSDINKTLYNRKDLFITDRQEGMKPIWKLLA